MSAAFRFALLGDPVEHSRSPAMHTAALKALGLNGGYEARKSNVAGMETAIAELRTGRLSGINVTMPLKTEAARLSDALTDEAAVSKSVNTLRAGNGVVEGHSTDVIAARELLDGGRFPPDAPLLLLGAGGAAAAILAAAGTRSVYLSSRSEARAADLASGHNGVEVIGFGVLVAGAIVVNATPLGMSGEALPEGLVEAASGIIDLAYGEGPTPAVLLAAERGHPRVDGIEFLARQAAASFEWWTGMVAPLQTMMDAARND